MPQAEHCFESLSADQAQHVLKRAMQQVCQSKTRVQINDGPHECFLISKEELETLERALEILGNTSEVQRIARQIAALTSCVANGPLIAAPVGSD